MYIQIYTLQLFIIYMLFCFNFLVYVEFLSCIQVFSFMCGNYYVYRVFRIA